MQMLLSQALRMVKTSQVMIRDITDINNPVIQQMSTIDAYNLEDYEINNRGIYQYDMNTTLITYERKGE